MLLQVLLTNSFPFCGNTTSSFLKENLHTFLPAELNILTSKVRKAATSTAWPFTPEMMQQRITYLSGHFAEEKAQKSIQENTYY